MESKMTILFGGDLALGNQAYTIHQKVRALFHAADASILNLEAPITNSSMRPHPKAGPQLAQGEGAIPLLTELRVANVSGANNHLMDYGAVGLKHTKQQLSEHGIRIGGCGDTLREASQPLIMGDSVAILCVCEEEFGIADAETPGCYSLYNDAVRDQVATLAANGMTTIVYAHGGAEMVPVPSEYIVQRYRAFIDAGASAVIGHHPHIPQGIEQYKNAPIVYSVGNFIHRVYPNCWGMLVRLTVTAGGVVECRPQYIELHDNTMRLAEDASRYMAYVEQLSTIMSNDLVRKQIQQEQALEMFATYYQSYVTGLFAPQPAWMRWYRALRVPAMTREHEQAASTAQQERMLFHLMRNRSHSEFMVTALGLRTGEIRNACNETSHTLYAELQTIIHES